MEGHSQQLELCVKEHADFKKHIEDSGPVRDQVVTQKEQIKTLFSKDEERRESIENLELDIDEKDKEHKQAIAGIYKKIDDSAKETRSTIRTWVLALILAVVAGILWTGRYLEKIDRLDRIHPEIQAHLVK